MTSQEQAQAGSADGAAAAFTSPQFQLDTDPLLSRASVDRSETVRDMQKAAVWPHGRVLLVDPRGRAELTEDNRLVHHPATEFGDSPCPEAVLLGVQDGVAYWALRAQGDQRQSGWRDLRTAGGLLGDTDAELLTTAVGLLGWHDRARYCTVCGASTTRIRAGWVRQCTGCGREEYPRTDPSMICLVHDGAEHVLLARQESWPTERYSVLAGFVEVGESLESCVRREVLEEVGVDVTGVRYLGSQPWPFPRSLMVGFAAVADPLEPLRPAAGEIGDARWIHRDHVRAALDADGPVQGLRLPPGISIAYRMLRGWATWPY